MLLVGKIIFLFIGVWFTLVNVAKFTARESISAINFINADRVGYNYTINKGNS